MITQSAGAVRGVEVFVELVGELAVVAGFGDFAPRRRIRSEEGITGAKPVIEEFTRQRIGEAKGDEDRHLACCQCGSLRAVFSMSPRGSKNFITSS